MLAAVGAVAPVHGQNARALDLAGTQWPADSIFDIAGTRAADDNEAWWHNFGDATLDTLVALGEKNNYNAAAACRRIAIARSQLGEARSAWFPQIDISAGYTREGVSGRTASRNGERSTMSYFNAGANLSWEIDVFGKVARQVRKAQKYVKLSAAEYGSVMIALQAEIATAYINLCVSRRQLSIAHFHSDNQKQLLAVVESRHKAGLASKLEVAQARTLYYSTVATVPMLEASIESAYNSIAVLTGAMPGELPRSIYTEKPLPIRVPLPDMGVPADLLRRRPDIAEAERNIEIAAAAVGIAKSEYLPSLSLNASIGTQAHNFGDLFDRQSLAYSVVPTLSWTLFDGLARRNTAAAARETLEAQVDNYNMTVLTAVEEVRNAVNYYKGSQEHCLRLEKVLENCREEVEKSVDLYKQGLTIFTNVVDAQQDYLSYQNSLVQARGASLLYVIQLYKALGGGWVEDIE